MHIYMGFKSALVVEDEVLRFSLILTQLCFHCRWIMGETSDSQRQDNFAHSTDVWAPLSLKVHPK